MLSTIDLDDQSCFQANKIRDVYTKRKLSTKLMSIDLLSPQSRPQAALGIGQILTQCSCTLGVYAISHFPPIPTFPHQGGRGFGVIFLLIEIPGSDIGINAFAARLSVGTQAEYIDIAVQPGIEIPILVFPRVLGETVEIAAAFPVARDLAGRGFLHQRLEALFGGRIDAVVQPIELECTGDGADIAFGGD